MLRLTKTLSLPLALAAALASPVLARAEDKKTEPPGIEALAKDVKDLKEGSQGVKQQLDRIEKALGTAEQNLRKDIEGINKQIDALNKLIDLLSQTQTTARADINELKRSLEKLEAQVNAKVGKLEEELTKQRQENAGLLNELNTLRKTVRERVAAAAPPPESGFGTIRLYNTSAVPVRIVINGRAYPPQLLGPGEEWTLPSYPAGTITYEVLGLGREERRTKTLRPNGTLDIEVFDGLRGPIRVTQGR